MKKINVAHDVLGDPVKRKRYHAEWLQRKGEKTSYTGTHAPPEPKPSSKSQPRQQQWGAKRKPPPITKQPSKKRRKITAYIISGLVVLIVIPIILMHTIFSPQYKIAFVSDRDGNSEIYVIDVDGDNLTRLTNNSGVDTEPAWSPDGKKIAFISDQDGSDDIYIINADGSNLRKIANTNNSEAKEPVWSPDAKEIALILTRKINPPYVITFSSGDTFTTEWVSDIFIINTDGSNQIQLTNNYPYRDYNHYPCTVHDLAWSPDGKKIAFESDIDFNDSCICVVNSDGSNYKSLTSTPFGDFCPRWSPDGTKIIFCSFRDGFLNSEIYIMDSDGNNQTRLTNHTDRDLYPIWSPDGKKIAFVSDRDGQLGLYVMNADGSGQTKLTTNLEVGYQAVWSPDGASIAFYAPEHSSSRDIYIINADGSNLKRITSSPILSHIGTGLLLEWSPR